MAGALGRVLVGGKDRGAGFSLAPGLVIDQALAIAGESQRTEAPARIHALTRTGMLDELSRWRLWSLRGSIELLTVFLGNSHDDTTADSIGLAVLEVAVETSMR